MRGHLGPQMIPKNVFKGANLREKFIFGKRTRQNVDFLNEKLSFLARILRFSEIP